METFLVSVKPEEAHLLSEFRRKVWETTYRGIYPDKLIDEFDFGFHDSKNLFMINSEEYSVYFITADGEKTGYLILQHKIPLYIQSLYLLPDFQRKGIGRKIFGFVREHCRKNEIQKFYLCCHPENKNALAFYEKMGGKITEKDIGHEDNRENNFKIEFSA
ncbi:MAG: GNAT family N-acetyltransferase [Oscillospiraceae bacterium]|nr:GNAT family N-acetyltransferase [Oscillospiraceae bacterium]MBR6657483.1 GNAT family N-acetyltransferase [Oscillospiraceae bacterium]